MQQNVNREKETTKAAAKKLKDYAITCRGDFTCPSCEGTRYNEKVMSSKINGYSIYDLTDMQLDELMKILMEID